MNRTLHIINNELKYTDMSKTKHGTHISRVEEEYSKALCFVFLCEYFRVSETNSKT